MDHIRERTQIKIRLRRSMLAQLTTEAESGGYSLNGEIVRRIEESFRAQDQLSLIFSDTQTFRLLDTLARIIRDTEITSGKSYRDDPDTQSQAAETIYHLLKLPTNLLNHAINGIPPCPANPRPRPG